MNIEKEKRFSRKEFVVLFLPFLISLLFLISILLDNTGMFLISLNLSDMSSSQLDHGPTLGQQLNTFGQCLLYVGVLSIVGAIVCTSIFVFWWMKEKKQQNAFVLTSFFLLLMGILLGIAGKFLVSRNPLGLLAPQNPLSYGFGACSLCLGISMFIGVMVLTFQWIEQEKLSYSFPISLFFIISALCISIFLILENPSNANSSPINILAGVSFLLGMIFLISAIRVVFKLIKAKKQGYSLTTFLFFLVSALSMSIFFIPGNPSGLNASSSPIVDVLFCLGSTFLISAIAALFNWMKAKKERYTLATSLFVLTGVLFYCLYISKPDSASSPIDSAPFLLGIIFLISATVAVISGGLK